MPVKSVGGQSRRVRGLDALADRVVACRRCPRLVRHRERAAREKVRRYRECEYWGRPVPGFGDPAARLLVVGLAPAAHGGNRTGRMFTGDRSSDFLYRALHRAGFANQPTAIHRNDGLHLTDCYITAVARCAPPANRPTPPELRRCRSFLLAELTSLSRVRVILALGQVAFQSCLDAMAAHTPRLPSPRPRFRHGLLVPLPGGPVVLASYHPSQRNTQTGRLSDSMFQRIVETARRHLAAGSS